MRKTVPNTRNYRFKFTGKGAFRNTTITVREANVSKAFARARETVKSYGLKGNLQLS